MPGSGELSLPFSPSPITRRTEWRLHLPAREAGAAQRRDPPTLVAAVPNRHAGHTIAIGRDRSKRATTATLVQAVEAGLVSRTDAREFGAVLAGDAPGRENADEVTPFDSTGSRSRTRDRN
jgi:hypothetical protein